MQPAIQPLENHAGEPSRAPRSTQPAPSARPCFRPWELTHNVTVLPNAFMDYKGLSPTAKLVYATLARYSHGKDHTYPKVRTIARKLNIGEHTVRRAIARLAQEGFLERWRRGKRLSNLYRFLPHPSFSPLHSPPHGNEPQPAPRQGDRPEKVIGQNGRSLSGQNGRSISVSSSSESYCVRSSQYGDVCPSCSASATAQTQSVPQPGKTPAENGEKSHTPREAQAELVRMLEQRTGEPVPQYLLEEIQLRLAEQGVPLAQFLLRLQPHLANPSLRNPVGFMRIFARRFNLLTSPAGLPMSRPVCPDCGLEAGKGMKWNGKEFVDCPTCEAHKWQVKRPRCHECGQRLGQRADCPTCEAFNQELRQGR